ncbi:MAG: hypothetical protein Q8K65_05940 [Alphaproteobacteria bacterium]|nr:hypothetical protein [Alphaproteobacteria bacterium]
MKSLNIYFIASLIMTGLFFALPAFSEPPQRPHTNNADDDSATKEPPFAEERKAAQNFIVFVNEARKELSLRQPELAKQKIITARNLLPLISRVTASQSRLTRVEFGGGLYADDLGQRKNYSPIETHSLETLTISSGPRWVKNTRSESHAKIIYITLNLDDGQAFSFLKQAEEAILADRLKDAEVLLAEMSDRAIKIDDYVPTAIQARDYISLANNYVGAGNFFGVQSCLIKTNEFLESMKSEETYKSHRADIISLHRDIETLQAAFAKLDAGQIETAEIILKKWTWQLSAWVNE